MSGRDQRPLAVGDVPRWDGETDVLVSGLGCAGATAALEAAAAGCQVTVLEMLGGGGGSSGLSGGEIYLGDGTSVHGRWCRRTGSSTSARA